MEKTKVIIWGIGDRTDKYIRFNYYDKCEIVGFVDKNKSGNCYNGKPIYSPSEIVTISTEAEYIVISTFYFSEIYAFCIKNGIEPEKIIITDCVEEELFGDNISKLKKISTKIADEIYLNRYKFIKMNEKDTLDTTRLIGTGKYCTQDYFSDYFRYRTFEYVADMINEKKINGDLAELGVFRGTFSSLISAKFPKKNIYLFDSFEGFNVDEIEEEKSRGRCSNEFVYTHKRTSEQIVLDNMPFPDKCHIVKGYFPESLIKQHYDMRFAFVSIDVDFENSIYAGLEFFYPRLEEGGFMFLHDYNSAFLLGVKAAVEKYEKDYHVVLTKIPIADRAGTLIITK